MTPVLDSAAAPEPARRATGQPAAAAPASTATPGAAASAIAPPPAAAAPTDALAPLLARAVARRATPTTPRHAVLARGKQLRTRPAAKAAMPARPPQVSEPETFTAAGLTGQRTKKVTAALVPTKVPERGRTPVAIAFAGTTPPLGYDGGHVIGLHLGGANVSSNVVPMYPRFNRGVWKVLEDRVKAEAHKRSGLVMTVTMTYAGTDPRIPSTFDVVVADGATGASVWTGSLSQPGDIPDVAALPGGLSTVIGAAESFSQPLGAQADQFLLGTGTFAEAVAATGGRHLPVSKRAMYPDDPANRPYGPLDILALNGMLRGFGTMGAFSDFTAAQRELLLQVNRERNGGTMRSDDPADPCQVLDPRGAANAPEIDHIIPKVLGGSNFFSNARVVSWQLNNKEDRIKPISELVDVSRLAAPTLPTLAAAKASVIAAQWLAHHPDDTEVAPALLSHWIVMRWPTLGPERLSPRLVKAVIAQLANQGVVEKRASALTKGIVKPRHTAAKRKPASKLRAKKRARIAKVS